jgi:hypothetical protein
VRAVEKIRPRAQFNGEHERNRDAQSWICVPLERLGSCQSGTVDDASYWDAPRLKSEFAAQVIGQALGEEKKNASAAAAYARTAVVLRPRFDKNF